MIRESAPFKSMVDDCVGFASQVRMMLLAVNLESDDSCRCRVGCSVRGKVSKPCRSVAVTASVGC